MIEHNLYYMNLPTGTVQRGEDWKDDQKHLGFAASDLENLVEVCWNIENQCWEERA